MWTYNPKLAAEKKFAWVPFDLWDRQREMLHWFQARLDAQEDGALVKSRDIGFTWGAGGFALHKWLFDDGFKTTFGSRKEELVDRAGDPDSIFEKIRMILYKLPRWQLPRGFIPKEHDNHCRLLNPENRNVIRGEAGDQMGRGGRNTLYFLDEIAFVERAERVEAATSANTDVRIFASSVNGPSGLFANKVHDGKMRPDQIFRFHFKDDPRKDARWEKHERERLEEHVFASEYDLDFSASVEGICISGKYVEAALKLKHLVKLPTTASGIGGLDVGGGKAKSVFVPRFGIVVKPPTSWGEPDTTETAHRALDLAKSSGCKSVRYDNVGIGRGVASALRRFNFTFGVNVGDKPTEAKWPDGETSQDKFVNLKAEAWWTARERFKCTYEYVLWLESKGKKGKEHDVRDCISLPDRSEGQDCITLAAQLSNVKWFRNEKGLIMIEPKDALAKRGVASPDHADALMLTFTGASPLDVWAKLAA